jgi:elongation factor G
MPAAGTPRLLLTIRPNTASDCERLDAGLRQILNDEPTLSADTDRTTGIRRDFGVNAALDRVSVAYRETLTCSADGECKFARQAGGRGEYAHAKIHVFPGESGSGLVFHNGCIGPTIPNRFVEPIRHGIEERCARGVLAGYPLIDVRIELYGGSYHDLDSSESAFKVAGAMALEDAAKKAAPVLLEPVMRVEAVVPKEFAAEVVANLLSRRGQIQADTDTGNTRVVQAVVPLSELFGYAADLRSRTSGRGVHSLRFEGYVRFDAEMNDDDRTSPVGAPRKPAPRRRDSAVALPEPDGDDRAET